jgi:hypothetical protein
MRILAFLRQGSRAGFLIAAARFGRWGLRPTVARVSAIYRRSDMEKGFPSLGIFVSARLSLRGAY